MDVSVWIDSWQQQCCGDEFRLGSEVRWPTRRNEDVDGWFSRLLGSERARHLDYVEDHHGGNVDGTLSGLVIEINVVTCSRVLADVPGAGPTGRAMVPVPGTARLRPVEVADPWEPEPNDANHQVTFDGWIVRLNSAEFAASRTAQADPSGTSVP